MRGFVNLNRYKHGRSLKRNSKGRTAPQSKAKVKQTETKFRGQGRLT